METNNKSRSYRAALGIVVILILVFIGIAGFKYINGKNAGLSTYTDSKFSFEFKYPSIYILSQSVDASCCYTREFADEASGTDFSVSVNDNTDVNQKTIDDLISESNSQQSAFGKVKTQKITVAGLSAVRMDYSTLTGETAKEVGFTDIGGAQIIWYKDNRIYSIRLRSTSKVPPVGLNAIDTVIKTFKYKR